MSCAIKLDVIFADRQSTRPEADFFEDSPGFEALAEGLWRDPLTGATGARTGYSDLVQAGVYRIRFPSEDALPRFPPRRDAPRTRHRRHRLGRLRGQVAAAAPFQPRTRPP